jgi:hypothetical protein
MTLLVGVHGVTVGVAEMSGPIEGPGFPIVGNIVPNKEWVITLSL